MFNLINGYHIEFIRKDFHNTQWSNSQFKYICIINIYNTLNLLVFQLTLNEIDISNICSLIYDFLEFGGLDGFIPLSYRDSFMNSYTLHISSLYNEVSNPGASQYIIIKEYNPQTEYIIDRIILEFNNTPFSDLFCFIEALYTNFLYDISEYSNIADYLYGG